MEKLRKFAGNMLEKDVPIIGWVGVFLGVIFLRTFTEQFLAKTSAIAPYEAVLEFIHNLLFFSITFLFLWILLSFVLRINPKKLSAVFLAASFIVLFPPLIDMARTGGETFWSFYILSNATDLKLQFLTLFGNLPSGIMYFGTKITFFSATFLLAGLAFLITKSVLKTAFMAISAYIVFFFMGSFPTLFTFSYLSLSKRVPISNIQGFDAVQLFGSTEKILGIDFRSLRFSFVYKLDFIFYILLVFLLGVLFWLINKKKTIETAKNSRYPQLIYHAGLFFMGIGLGIFYYPQNFSIDLFPILVTLVLLASVWLSWLSSVIINDIYDKKTDNLTNPSRPLPRSVFSEKEYMNLGVVFLLLSLLGGMIVGFDFFFLLAAYNILAWFYSAPPLRLKRYVGLASLVSAIASLMIFFLGFILMSNGQDIHSISIKIIILLVVSYTLSIPVKDFKDIKGDKEDGVYTVPVIFGEKKGRIIIGAGIFASYVLSVFLLNERALFWWAVLFGGAAFLVMQKKDIEPKNLPWCILPLAAAYGLILVLIVFVK